MGEPNRENDKLVPIDDVAAELQMCRATLYRHMRRRDISTYGRPGSRSAFVRRADVERLKEPVAKRRRPARP